MKYPINVLFLCTGNSARSIISEALCNDLGSGQWHGFSAGSHPSGQPHPQALECLAKRGHEADAFRSKSWDEFASDDAPQMDIIITVCDNAAGEICPIWPGHPLSAHWPAPDPAHITPVTACREAFADVYDLCKRRIEAMLALDVQGLNAGQLNSALIAIGQK